MEDTSGFYKNDNGYLLVGKNFVLAGSYNLFREEKDSYTYPIGGWKWFDSEEKAREEYNLPKPISQNESNTGYFPYPNY
jgi:hypothetical protein